MKRHYESAKYLKLGKITFLVTDRDPQLSAVLECKNEAETLKIFPTLKQKSEHFWGCPGTIDTQPVELNSCRDQLVNDFICVSK